jgi:hypothetical protein
MMNCFKYQFYNNFVSPYLTLCNRTSDHSDEAHCGSAAHRLRTIVLVAYLRCIQS